MRTSLALPWFVGLAVECSRDPQLARSEGIEAHAAMRVTLGEYRIRGNGVNRGDRKPYAGCGAA